MGVVQLALWVMAMVILYRKGYDFKYLCLFFVPFQSMPLLNLAAVSSYLIAVQLTFVIMLATEFKDVSRSLRRDIGFVCILLFFPFVVSYVYNMFYFTPVYTFETDAQLRGQLRTALNSSNITQLAYVIFAYALFWVFSSLQLELDKLRKIIDYSIYVVVAIGAFQWIGSYVGLTSVYKFFFYTLDLGLVDQRIGGWKRINSTFIEPSYFGFWSSFTLFFYLNCFGLKVFLRSRAVHALFICALWSTTTTFYLGAVFLLIIAYLFYLDSNQKVFIYSVVIMLSPLLLYFGYDSISTYISNKQGSTDLRSAYSIDVAMQVFWSSPVFGKAYGTTKSFFIYTQMPAALGVFGVTILCFAFSMLMKNIGVASYIIGVVLLGLGNFEYTRPELWVYLGLLCNPYIVQQVKKMQNEELKLRQASSRGGEV